MPQADESLTLAFGLRARFSAAYQGLTERLARMFDREQPAQIVIRSDEALGPEREPDESEARRSAEPGEALSGDAAHRNSSPMEGRDA